MVMCLKPLPLLRTNTSTSWYTYESEIMQLAQQKKGCFFCLKDFTSNPIKHYLLHSARKSHTHRSSVYAIHHVAQQRRFQMSHRSLLKWIWIVEGEFQTIAKASAVWKLIHLCIHSAQLQHYGVVLHPSIHYLYCFFRVLFRQRYTLDRTLDISWNRRTSQNYSHSVWIHLSAVPFGQSAEHCDRNVLFTK